MTASVYTNLTLVTEEKLDFIKEHYIQLITSVDFKEARKHDTLRGKKGAFAKTIEMLDYAKKIGIIAGKRMWDISVFHYIAAEKRTCC